MIYPILRKILFTLDPEAAHRVALDSLKYAHQLGLTRFLPVNNAPRSVMGLDFPNPLGLAAGLDKNGDYIDALAALGFGFIEIGTVTPKPQDGNPKPRLFRLPEFEAIINRMGFNNKGLDYVIERLKQKKFSGILGVNIGKNASTPIEYAADDYFVGFQRTAPYASYITINISSPNTMGLRDLQHGEFLQNLLQKLKRAQASQKKYVPLVVKIAPDLTVQEIESIGKIFLAEKIDGVIATNTTISRDGIENSPLKNESGGLSGKPLFSKSLTTVQTLQRVLQNQIPIVGCGGISNPQEMQQMLNAGASLVQVYTSLIYQGPKVVSRLLSF